MDSGFRRNGGLAGSFFDIYGTARWKKGGNSKKKLKEKTIENIHTVIYSNKK
jgi:hypothetical protein